MASSTIYMHITPDDRFEVDGQNGIQLRSGFAQHLVLFLPGGKDLTVAQEVVGLLNELILASQASEKEAA